MLALSRYLRDAPTSGLGSTLPSPPSAILLQSPWTDPSGTHVPSGPGPTSASAIINLKTDIIDRSPRSAATIGYVGLKGKHITDEEARTNVLISPGSLDLPNNGDGLFERFPRTHVLVGGSEILADEIRLLAKRIANGRKGDAEAALTQVGPSHLQNANDHIRSDKVEGSEKFGWVTMYEDPDMYHDWCCVDIWEAKRQAAFKSMISWIIALPPGIRAMV